MCAVTELDPGDPGSPERLPRGRGALRPDLVQESQRRRLLNAMAQLAGTQGIADVTVGDLVAQAGVARNSFYALFSDKTDCYVSAYRLCARSLFEGVRDAMNVEGDPATRLLDGIREYLAALHRIPHAQRAFLLQPVRTGASALSYDEQIHARLASLLLEQHRRAREKHPELEAVTVNAMNALTAGITELARRESDGGAAGAGREADAIKLTIAVLGLEAAGLGGG
jgi:AcrR family transcriptional regulator